MKINVFNVMAVALLATTAPVRVAPLSPMAAGLRYGQERLISDPQMDLDYRCGAVAQDHDLWMVVALRPKFRVDQRRAFEVRRVSLSGRDYKSINIDDNGRTATEPEPAVAVVIVDGRPVLIGPSGVLRYVDPVANKLGREVTIRPLPPNAMIRSATALAGRDILVIGESRGMPWVGLVSGAGKLVRQRELSGDSQIRLAGAVGVEGGDTILFGVSIKDPASKPLGWIARLDENFVLHGQTTLERPVVDVSRYAGDGIMVLEEEYIGPNRSVWWEAIDSEFKKRSTGLLATVRGVYPFAMSHLAATPIVAGYTSDRKPWLASLTAVNPLNWSLDPLAAPEFTSVSHVDVPSTPWGGVAVFGLAVVDEIGEQRRVIRMVELSAL